MSKITPYSQITALFTFALSAFIAKLFFIPLLQILIIGASIILCKVKITHIHLRRMLAIVPILFFVIGLNSFRGTGIVLFHLGPLILVRQGVWRGVYYAVIILEIYCMSMVLTIGFSKEVIVSSLIYIDQLFSQTIFMKRKRQKARSICFFMLLYYVLGIAQFSYIRLPRIIKDRKISLKERIIVYISESFKEAEVYYDSIHDFSYKKISVTNYDIGYVSIQIFLIVIAIIVHKWILI